MKTLIAVLTFMVLLVGCQSNPITYQKVELDDAVSQINNSESISILHGEDKGADVTEITLPVDKIEQSDATISESNPTLTFMGTKDQQVSKIDLYQQDEQYYLVTFAYETKESTDKVYVPMEYEEETVYELDETTYQEIMDEYAK